MRLLKVFLVPLGALLFSDGTLGQKGMFLEKYGTQIQNYIMTGHAGGWQNCDILSANTFSVEGTPQISMALDKINAMNIKSAFASSQCVLVNYHVGGIADLQELIDFGWAAIDHVRIALVLKMGSGITLDMVTNATKLPFLVAAELRHSKEQFLCPVVGEMDPRLEQTMCKHSYVSYYNKTLRISQSGPPPDFIRTRNGLDGINIRMMNTLGVKLNFKPQIIVPKSMLVGDELVCNHTYIMWVPEEMANNLLNYRYVTEILTSL